MNNTNTLLENMSHIVNTNTLESILNTILTNTIIQKTIGIYDIMKEYNKDINKQIPNKYYELLIQKLSGKKINTTEIHISKLKRYVMMLLPPNPNIENLLDTNYKIKQIQNKQDRASIIYYLSKS